MYSVVVQQRAGHARRPERLGVHAAIVAQRVLVGRDDGGWRQAGVGGGAQRGNARVAGQLRLAIAQVGVVEEVVDALWQDEGVGVFAPGWGVQQLRLLVSTVPGFERMVRDGASKIISEQHAK
jgi:hypothetical protein